MNASRRYLPFAVGLLLPVATSIPSHAQLISAETVVHTILGSSQQIDSETSHSLGSFGIAASRAGATGSAAANGSFATAPGLITAHLAGSATVVPGPHEGNSARTFLNANYHDTLTITGESDGTAGVLSTWFVAATTLGSSATGEAFAVDFEPLIAAITLGTTTQTFAMEFRRNPGDPLVFTSTFPDNFLVKLSTPFVYGTPFDLEMVLDGVVAAVAGSFGAEPESKAGAADFTIGLAAFWAGGVGVTDSDGNVLPFAINAESGIDYRLSYVPDDFRPIPEPGTYALAASALLGLLILRRGRHRWIRHEA